MADSAAQARQTGGDVRWLDWRALGKGRSGRRDRMQDKNVVRANYLFNLARQQGTNGGRSLDDGSMGVFLVHVQGSLGGLVLLFR